ncbi:hypothetical protein CK485_21995 [Streptomyces sp. ICBB 8177]|nr:hypothetical protein CK485_21995 [Streptomyces sp. ICBB 8177]
MAALALGTGAPNAVAATDAGGYADLAVACAPTAANVCAHLQEQPGDSTTGPQVLGQGTADTGHGITIVQVTLTENTGGTQGSSSMIVASTTQTVTSGTQLTAGTPGTDEQCSYKIVTVSYTTTVQYRVGTGSVQTITTTGGGNCFPF